MNRFILALVLTTGLLGNAPLPAADDHDHEADTGEARPEHGHEEENRVHLNAAQQHAAGIVVEPLRPAPLAGRIEAPGEIRLNRYATHLVTPRIEAQIVARHARLGDHVTQGQPLVTLSSIELAEAQGQLLISAREWQRVRKLGKKVVSARRYLESRVAYQQARGRLLAFGLGDKAIDSLLKGGSARLADGRFELHSPRNGTVIEDDFIVGQRVTPGQPLFKITDESTLWVEARVHPRHLAHLRVGAPARVEVDDAWLPARVIQIHHTLDETTRTLGVRLALKNPQDRLHPGQFVSVAIETEQASQPVLSLPSSAIQRSPDGDWQVFVEAEPGEFEPHEVRILRRFGERVAIDGIPAGTRVVMRGAFFVQSELAKSGFAVHNH